VSDESLDCQVGNEMRSIDLIDCEEGRREIPYFQVGKGEERILSESLMNSAEISYQQGELMEQDQRCILIIGGIKIFLPNSPAKASTSVSHEEVVQQESKKEAMGPNSFKANCFCDVGAAEEGQPTVTIMMKEKISKSSQGEEEEEHIVEILTQWEMELRMLEDWLDNPESKDGCQETVMQILGEEHSTKLLKSFSQGLNRR
jgi:hypothetical protein